MAILGIPTWVFEPNWTKEVTETLEWVTDILQSPTGAEQRRCLRTAPRVTLEFDLVAEGRERAYLDSYLMKYGVSDCYLPLWHEAHVLSQSNLVGATTLSCDTAEAADWRAGDVMIIRGTSIFQSELKEIASVGPGSIEVQTPMVAAWPAGTLMHPLRKARLTEQPQITKLNDAAVMCAVRFRIQESRGEPPLQMLDDVYRNFSVMDLEPDEIERATSSYDRNVQELDYTVGVSTIFDLAGIAFERQSYRRVIDGHAEHVELRRLLNVMRGRWRPVWLPTYFQDFTLAAPALANASTIFVDLVNFASTGGPTPARRDIMIEKLDGTRIFARITGASSTGGAEALELESPLGVAISPEDVLRISFMRLCRLDQDIIEISHKTDSSGKATVALTFRAAPDLRQVQLGI